MQVFIVGVDAQGRSAVVSSRTIAFPDRPGFAVEELWSMAAPSGEAPLSHPANSSWMDLGVDGGAVRWFLWRLTPGSVSDMHHTDTVDAQVVLKGEVCCILGAGEVRPRAGDAILIPRLEHQWVAGPRGGRLSGVIRVFRGGRRPDRPGDREDPKPLRPLRRSARPRRVLSFALPKRHGLAT